MPVVLPIFVITDYAHRTVVSEQSARDSALVQLLESKAACSGCRVCYLKGKKVARCGHVVCPACWVGHDRSCPEKKCVGKSNLEDYDISRKPEIRRLYLTCPKDSCKRAYTYVEIDGHIARHNRGDSSGLPATVVYSPPAENPGEVPEAQAMAQLPADSTDYYNPETASFHVMVRATNLDLEDTTSADDDWL